MPRESDRTPTTTIEDGPPGPIHFEVRINGKTAVAQRIHDYVIDQDDRAIMVTATVRKTAEPTVKPPDNDEPDEQP